MKRVPATQRTVIPGVRVAKLKSPVFSQVELTARCQYDCVFCYNVWKDTSNKARPSLSREQVLLVLQKLFDCEIFSLIFSGGEPTLYAYLPEAVELAAKRNIDVSMISNGARFSVPYLRSLRDAGLTGIQLSMHHYDPARLDAITQRRGSFQKTLRGVLAALEVFGSDQINVNMVVTKLATADVYAMGEFLHRQGLTSFTTGLVSFCGQAAVNQLSLGRADLHQVYAQLAALNAKYGLEVGFTGGLPFCAVPKYGLADEVQMFNTCDAAICQVVVGPDGNIRPCVESSRVVGNALTDSIVQVWNTSQALQDIRMFKNTPTSCHSCKFVAECHGGCRAAALRYTGDPKGTDLFAEGCHAIL